MIGISELVIKFNVECCDLGSISVRVLFDFLANSLRLGLVFIVGRQLEVWHSSQTQVALNTFQFQLFLIKFPEQRNNILFTTITAYTIH